MLLSKPLASLITFFRTSNKAITNFLVSHTCEEFCRRVEFDENGRKFSKRVEYTVGKGEVARYEQFLLFQLCFQKACFPEASKGVIVWEGVKELQESLDMCTGRCDITEIMLQTALNIIQSIIQHN